MATKLPRKTGKAARTQTGTTQMAASAERPVAELLHDLHVYQTELEAQNETLRRSQAALEESLERYHKLYDAAPVGYLMLNEAGLIATANLTAASLLGMERQLLVGKPFRHLVAASDRDRWHALFRNHRQGDGHACELTMQRGNGEIFQALLECRNEKGDADGQETRLTFTDISQRKKAETQLIASEERYLALFREASDAIAIADANGIIEEVNHRFAALLGYDENELRGMSIERIHPADELPSIRQRFAEILGTSEFASMESRVLRKDGTPLEVEIRSSQIEIGGRKVAQGIFIDLTERRQKERQRIDQETEHRDTLIREVHHRIKNNLQSVAGLLRRELGKFVELNPRLEAAISQVHAIAVVHGLQSANQDEALRLCDSVRNICRTVAELSQRPVQFDIENEHTTFRPVQIENSEAVPVALVLNELILNAVKHSPAGGRDPTVSLSADGSSAQLLIRNGVASAPAFDLAKGKGLGTGLRLVRSLLPNRGAQLTYELDSEGLMCARLKLAAPVTVSIPPKKAGRS